MIIPCPGSGTCLVITGYPFLFYWMMHKYAIIIFYSFLFHANAWFIGPLPAPRSSLNSNASERYCFALFTDSSSSNSFRQIGCDSHSKACILFREYSDSLSSFRKTTASLRLLSTKGHWHPVFDDLPLTAHCIQTVCQSFLLPSPYLFVSEFQFRTKVQPPGYWA